MNLLPDLEKYIQNILCKYDEFIPTSEAILSFPLNKTFFDQFICAGYSLMYLDMLSLFLYTDLNC